MPKVEGELKTRRLSVNVTGPVELRLRAIGDMVGQAPPVVASFCLGMGLKALEAQLLGLDPRLLAEASIEYERKIGRSPVTKEEMMSAGFDAISKMSPEVLARLGLGPEQLARFEEQGGT